MKNNRLTFCFLFFLSVIMFIVLLIGCKKSDLQSSREYEIEKNYTKGPLSVNIKVSKSEISLADTFWLEFETAIEQDYELTMPATAALSQNFGILDWYDSSPSLDKESNVIKIQRYRLEPLVSGTFQIPEFTFEFKKSSVSSQQGQSQQQEEDKIYELITEPINITVISLLEEQKAELNIEDIEGVIDIPKKQSFWYIWSGIFVLLGVVILLIIRFRPAKRIELSRIFKPAHEIAYARLKKLVSENLIDEGRIKEFYERINDILRHYIEHRFNLRAPEQTTEEFLMTIRNTKSPVDAYKSDLEKFLEHCDLVKFAKYDPTSDQIQKSFDLVKDFIEKTKSDEKQIEIQSGQTEIKPDISEVA